MATSISSTSPRVGEVAPDFSLDSTAGTPVRLSDYREQRNVLLAVFPWAHIEDQVGHRRHTDELLAEIEELD